MKERLTNSSPALVPGKPSPAVVAERHAWLLRKAAHYLRTGDASLRRHALNWLALLRQRQAVRA